MAAVVKNPPANAGDVRDLGSIPGSGRSPGGGHGNPLQYSCLENPMDRGAWQATVHKVHGVGTSLKKLSKRTRNSTSHRELVHTLSLLLSPPLSTYRGEGRRRMEKGKKKGRGGGRYERRKQKA